MRVSFFLPGEQDLEALHSLDPAVDWRAFKVGEHVWLLQTYLHLRRSGFPVELCGELPDEGLVVFHAKHRKRVRRERSRRGQAILVGVRGDVGEPLVADFQVLQNGLLADGRRRFFVPHWPQPALRPRDPSRGAAIRRAAFKGHRKNLHPGLRSRGWREALRERGIGWEDDSADYVPGQVLPLEADWADYREVDLMVAIRSRDRRRNRRKPATKLYNAWHAGVPAILGAEPAYRELRRSELDYVEATGVREALEAIDRLRAEPERYLAMIDNGRRRAPELGVESIVGHWSRLLFETIPGLVDRRSFRLARKVPMPVRMAVRATASSLWSGWSEMRRAIRARPVVGE